MESKIDKLKYYFKYKMPKSIFAYVLLGVIVGGYLFFAISAIFFPEVNVERLLFTDLNENVDLGFSKNVSIKSWDYCASEGRMSVILNYSGVSSSGKLEYTYTAAERSKNNSVKELNVSEKYTSETYQLLVIDEVDNNFKEVVLRIEAKPESLEEPENPDEENQEKNADASLYTNFEEVSVVDELADGNIKDIMLRILDKDIDNLLDQIEDLNESINTNKKRISEIDSSIEGLNKDIIYETADGVKSIRDQISRYQEQKDDILSENIEIETEIKSTEVKIRDINIKIEEITNGNIKISETEPETENSY